MELFLFSVNNAFWNRNYNRIIDFFLAAPILTTLLINGKAILMILINQRLFALDSKGDPANYYFMYTELSGWLSHPGYMTLYVAMAIFLFIYKIFENGVSA